MPYLANLDQAGGGGGGGTINDITSADGSVTITNPLGPITDLSVAVNVGDVKQSGPFGTDGILAAYTNNAVDPTIRETTLTETQVNNAILQVFQNAANLGDIMSFLNAGQTNQILQKQSSLPNLLDWLATWKVQLGQNAVSLPNSIAIGQNAVNAVADEILLTTPSRTLKMAEDDYIQLNNVDKRFEGSVLARWQAANIGLPFSVNLPVPVITSLPILPTSATADPKWTSVVGGIQYNGTTPLSAIIWCTVVGGRQAAARMWTEFGVGVNGGFLPATSASASVSRFRSNGNGECSNLTMCTQTTLQPGAIVGPVLRQLGGLTTPTTQFNYIDAHIVIM